MPDQIVEQMQAESVQARARQQDEIGFVSVSLLHWLSQAGTIAPPWWSKRRDRFLRNFWKQEDHLAGAIYTLEAKLTSVPVRVEPRTPAVRAHRKQAEDYTIRLVEGSEFGQSWMTLFGKWLKDLWSQDNGLFGEVIGDGPKDGPIVGPALGLAHLDSWRCTRTRDIDFPVIYEDTTGERFKLHRTRVVYYSQMSSPAVEMNGVGFSAASRLLNNAQHLLDISTYEQEKLGSRPVRNIMLTGGGLDPEDLESAFKMAARSMDAQGLSRFSKSVLLGKRTIPEPTLDTVDLASLPDGFDKRESVTLGMFAIALAFAVPPRWLWPASVTGATKADAMYAHIAGLGGGAGQTLQMMAYLLGGSNVGNRHMAGKFLPPHLKLVFDFQDDEQDRMRAEVKQTRAERRKIDLETGVVSIRVAREQALADGDLTKVQFAQLELADGRLEDGSDVLTLFSSADTRVKKLLKLGVKEPLLIEENDQAEMIANIDKAILKVQGILTGIGTAGEQERAKQAMAALRRLRDMYEEAGREVEPKQPELEEELEEGELEEGDEEGEKGLPFELKLSRSFRDLETGGATDYRRMLRAAVRGLWTGALDRFGFREAMSSAILRGLGRAWRDGAAECGIAFDELSDAELRRLNERIDYEHRWIEGYADAIEAGSRAEGGKLTPLYVRAEIWIGRYEGVKTEARTMACADRKLKWVLGPAEHCSSCLKLNNKVKRGSWWHDNGVLPRIHGAPYLECQGFNCKCMLVQTDEPMSRGRMPSLP